MRSLLSLVKKELTESFRTGRFAVLTTVFVLLGIMNPAVAKFTPFIMKKFAESMEGFVINDIEVNALTSWMQFFKNIPLGLIAFVLMYSDIFTKEYKSGTLRILLTKGLPRYKVVLSKALILFVLWSAEYWLCFGVTYGYNAYFWDNSITVNLFSAATDWWIFGIWTISLAVLFSALASSNTAVILSASAVILSAYLIGMIPKIKKYVPTALLNSASLLSGGEQFWEAFLIAVVAGAVFIAVSIPITNAKKV